MILLTMFLACFPEITRLEEERFPENPNHDYDEDGIGDAEDCDDANSDIGRPLTYYADSDGDGFGVEAQSILSCPADKPDGYIEAKERLGVVVFDCDDENVSVNPDEQEVCDDVDNDCNGQIDEADGDETNRWYVDSDGDGFGVYENENSIIYSCQEIPGLSSNFLDCDDSNADISPDAVEVCDGVDNNCDTVVDENAAADAVVWLQDGDGDGYGSNFVTLRSCEQPSGYVSETEGGDCNDADDLIHPNATEVCNSADDDCDGLVDEGADSTAPVGSSTFYADGDGDGYGDPSSTLLQCNVASGFVSNADDCDDGNSGLNPDTLWYADSDGDGEGDAANALTQCTQPANYVSNTTDCDDGDSALNSADVDGDGASSCGGDCDDTDAALNLSDADGDGMDSCSGDCDDGVASIYLNAPETCNGVDDDCDGSTDESDAIDKSEWFADSDGDGYGTGGTSQFACNQPSGFVSQSGDCDDTDGAVLPTATEVCDGVDNNCDGLVDDADANLDLNTATEYFQDADFDGYGNPLQSTFSCLQTPGFVANSDDCDDGNLLRNPDGFEYCNNIDDNCDGTIDELAVDSTDYFVDADGDGHGALVDTTTGFDLNSCPTFDPITNLPIFPTGYSSTNDDCDDGDAAISPSASELCSNDVDENCDGHNTAGATDVSTFLVDADGDTFGSGERDSNGDLAYALDLCVQPYGYVPYLVGDSLDCDDGDFAVKPGAVEKCNGKRDNCPADGDNSVPVDEVDDDGDGFVECTLDPQTYVVLGTEEDEFNQVYDVITVNNWSDSTVTILGGGDCDDNDVYTYPRAEELCNGAYENCADPSYTTLDSPDLETDDDGDCFVECYGFDATIWEGGLHSCEHVDGTGQVVQETVVIGGEDCNDDNADTYVGAAYNDPTVCAQDADGDGDADCNLVGLVSSGSYFCDFGVDLPNGGMGPDFVLIQGGLEPLGRYTLTNDFYVMTTEVTQGMWNGVMGDGSSSSIFPKDYVDWYDAIAFANRLSVLTGREECYSTTDLLSTFTSPHDCNGFRLLTEAEWEYAARSGTTSDFWTGQGSALGGTYSTSTNTGNETILDGVSDPLLRDYAWYAGNRNNQYGADGSKEVGQKLPNGFGLYDMHGNLVEWTADWWGCSFPQTSTDPYCGSVDSYRVRRGGYWYSDPSGLRVSSRYNFNPWTRYDRIGFRLGLHP